MGFLVPMGLVALPSLLIGLGHWLLRTRPGTAQLTSWFIVIGTWIAAAVAWFVESQQTHDVGLMIYGIIALATLGAAILATLTAVLLRWRIRGA